MPFSVAHNYPSLMYENSCWRDMNGTEMKKKAETGNSPS